MKYIILFSLIAVFVTCLPGTIRDIKEICSNERRRKEILDSYLKPHYEKKTIFVLPDNSQYVIGKLVYCDEWREDEVETIYLKEYPTLK